VGRALTRALSYRPGMPRTSWIVAILLAAAITGTILAGRRCRSDDAAPAATTAEPVAPTTPRAAPHPPDRVQRVSPEARRRLAEQIAAAREARERAASSSSPSSATSPTPPPTLDHELSVEELEKLKTPILDTLKAIDPFLEECYQRAKPSLAKPGLGIKGALFLTGDADLGAIVDAGALTDDADQPLPKPFEDCVRNVLVELEMPPLREGDKVQVTYVFTFDDKK
jgi:hypothetical protein